MATGIFTPKHVVTFFLVSFLVFFQFPLTNFDMQAAAGAENSRWSDAFGNSASGNSRAPDSNRRNSGGSWNSVVDNSRSSSEAFTQPAAGGRFNRDEEFIQRSSRPSSTSFQNFKKTDPVKTAAQKTEPSSPAKVKAEIKPMPLVKFSATNPCDAAAADTAGLPWDTESSETEIDLPEDIKVDLPPVLPDLEKLTEVSYNSAVSMAFEGMRLVYGPLSKVDAQKFEAAWAPLFDSPTQEIVDYLNKLNPSLSQFLACREAYLRNLNDLQMVLFDAAFAIEMDEQQAWEAAMTEAGIYTSAITPLDAAMKVLAEKIEKLGNPPDPNAAKCARRRRYKKALQLSSVYPFEGEWENSQGERFLLKVAYSYPDGKLLVYNFPISWFQKMKAAGFKVNATGQLQSIDGKLAMMPGVYDLLQVFEEIKPDVWVSLNWSLCKIVFIYRLHEGEMDVSKIQFPGSFDKTTTRERYMVYKKDTSSEKPPVLGFDGGNWDDLLQVMPEKTWSGNKYNNYINWRKNSAAEIAATLAIPLDNGRQNSPAENDTPGNNPPSNPANSAVDNDASQADVAQAEKEKKEAIETHSEMVKVIKHDLDREISERDEVLKSLAQAQTRAEAEKHHARLKQLNLRIIGLESNLQSEQDLITSYETGKLVHTRQVFDDYARAELIDNMRQNAANIDATRRIAARIDRQIELLPWQVQAKARKLARKMLDSKTIASGDLKKARSLTQAFNKEIQGYAEYDRAIAEEAEINAQENEVMADLGIMAVGMGCIGFGSAALAEAYGAETAVSIYGPNLLGAVYGGTTGLVRGGPKEGVVQAVSWCSPKGFAAMQFVEGYENAGYNEDASSAEKIWAGVKQAGTAYAIGKVIELGSGYIRDGSLIIFGEESRIFRPITKLSSKRAAEIVDTMRTSQNYINEQEALKTVNKIEVELAFLKHNNQGQNVQKIAALENDLQQLASSLNGSYYSKWLLKYKIPPGIRRQADLRIQKNYARITPGINTRLEAKGYNMREIEFKQFRNSSSAGSSSMDLDWGPVLKRTGQEPGFMKGSTKVILKKDGSVVTLKTFMNDAQEAMNLEYHEVFGMSAPMSDMNMVTSVHKEAFSTTKLLEKNINFSDLTAEEIASVGKVLKVKMDGIDKNKMLTNITKMQARCRESAKEIDNMLLKKLRQDLTKAKAGSPQQKQIQSDINYWEDMLRRFQKIGMEETNPLEVIRLNREIMYDTGGRDITRVIDDLIQKFK